MRPLIKFAGGKSRLLPEILLHVPKKFGRYLEPFVGGGALFFRLFEEDRLKKGACIADTNVRLIRTYRAVQIQSEHVIRQLKKMKNEEKFFYTQRSRAIDTADDVQLAAWFIYLNKTAFNGLYRVNSQGDYNVPFGNYRNPNICDVENIRACARALTGIEIQHGSFEYTMRSARKGDFVYCDPPYLPLSKTSNFVGYSKDGFSWEDHCRLHDAALAAKKRGVHVLISNSAHPAIREMYEGTRGGVDETFTVDTVKAPRSINSKGGGRAPIPEFLIY